LALLPSDLLGRGIDDLSAYVIVNTGAVGLYPLIKVGDLETRAANRTVICAVVIDQWSVVNQQPVISFGSGVVANDWRASFLLTGPTGPIDPTFANIFTFGDATPVYTSTTLGFSVNLTGNGLAAGTFRAVAYGWQE
jgi:hypothetical protein